MSDDTRPQRSANQFVMFVVACSNASLDVIEEEFSPWTVKGIDARSSGTSSTAFEAKKSSVESVSPERSQRPSDIVFTSLIEDQIRFSDFQLPWT
jgi:hypothetical protein